MLTNNKITLDKIIEVTKCLVNTHDFKNVYIVNDKYSSELKYNFKASINPASLSDLIRMLNNEGINYKYYRELSKAEAISIVVF